jgi:hypothetical protein
MSYNPSMSKYVENLEKKVFELEEVLSKLSISYENLSKRYDELDSISKQWAAFIRNGNYDVYQQYSYHTITASSLYYLIRKLGEMRKKHNCMHLCVGKRSVLCWYVTFTKHPNDEWFYEFRIHTHIPRIIKGKAPWKDIVKFIRNRCKQRGIDI